MGKVPSAGEKFAVRKVKSSLALREMCLSDREILNFIEEGYFIS